MSAVAAPNGNRGILRQLHVVRELRFSPPADVPRSAILACVADELRRAGNDVVRVAAGHVEFYDDDPPNFLFEHRGPRLPVNGGVVTPGEGRLRLEMWMPPCLYVEPLALVAVVLIAPMLPTTKAVLLVILLGLGALHLASAWQAFECRLVDAARRASAG